jgi:hypothetical protein
MGTLVIGSHFKSTPGPGRGFLKYKGDILAFQLLLLGMGVFGFFQVGRQIQQVPDLIRCKIKQFQETPVFEIRRHRSTVLWVTMKD